MMKLTKEQIQFIDNYLTEQGVKYWDVRIELIDHVASKLEENEKIELNRTLLIRQLGSSVSLIKLVDKKQKLINKKYRKLYFIEVFSFFKDIKKMLILAAFWALYYVIFKRTVLDHFKYIALIIFSLPLIPYVLIGLKNHYKKDKSINLERAFHYTFSSFLILQIFFQVYSPSGIFKASLTSLEITLLVIPPLNVLLFYCGFRVYQRVFKEYSKTYKQLKSL